MTYLLCASVSLPEKKNQAIEIFVRNYRKFFYLKALEAIQTLAFTALCRIMHGNEHSAPPMGNSQ